MVNSIYGLKLVFPTWPECSVPAEWWTPGFKIFVLFSCYVNLSRYVASHRVQSWDPSFSPSFCLLDIKKHVTVSVLLAVMSSPVDIYVCLLHFTVKWIWKSKMTSVSVICHIRDSASYGFYFTGIFYSCLCPPSSRLHSMWPLLGLWLPVKPFLIGWLATTAEF